MFDNLPLILFGKYLGHLLIKPQVLKAIINGMILQRFSMVPKQSEQ